MSAAATKLGSVPINHPLSTWLEDSALAAEVAKAQSVSIEGLFEAYARYVGAIALKILGARQDVDEVVQDVFIEAIKHVHTLRDPGAVKNWLATVTVRVARARLRRERFLRFFNLANAPSYADVASEGATAEERVLLTQLYAVLDRLPLQERVAWTLRHLQGEQLTDIAKQMGCSLATIKRKIAAAELVIDEAHE